MVYTKNNKTSIKTMDDAVKMGWDNPKEKHALHLKSSLAPAMGMWEKTTARKQTRNT